MTQNNDDLTLTLLRESAKMLALFVLEKLGKLIKTQNQDNSRVSEATETHLIEVVNWASNVQVFGLSTPQSTREATIGLTINTEPRRFQSTIDRTKTINETDLLSQPYHMLLLGEPGSGKTTTLKRLALTMVQEEPVEEHDTLQYPMVIVLRELSENETMLNKIAGILGLVVETHEYTTTEHVRDENGKLIYNEIKHTELRIGNDKAENVLPKFLNDGRVLLLVDGLDELNITYREKIRNEIISIGRRLSSSKIIVSCRSGDYTRNMDGFSVLEICPLTEKQIRAIKEKWLGAQEKEFLNLLKGLPYADVADRPLLLAELLLLYKRRGYLPDQPSQIYKQLIHLMLEDWDAQRGIKRVSNYGGFDPRKKHDFLAALSYYLTYSLQKSRFKEQDLILAYMSMCGRFRLPPDQAVEVAHEIQTHTGIITISGPDVYEFCHLSFQEYLCADYLVRGTLSLEGNENVTKNPNPPAVAVALSSDPSNWFGTFILSFKNINVFGEETMTSFLSRVLIERPLFEVSDVLGFALLLLFKRFAYSTPVIQQLLRMLETDQIKKSIAGALRWYVPKQQQPSKSDFTEVSLNQQVEKVYKVNTPLEGAFPNKLISDLKKLNVTIHYAKK